MLSRQVTGNYALWVSARYPAYYSLRLIVHRLQRMGTLQRHLAEGLALLMAWTHPYVEAGWVIRLISYHGYSAPRYKQTYAKLQDLGVHTQLA